MEFELTHSDITVQQTSHKTIGDHQLLMIIDCYQLVLELHNTSYSMLMIKVRRKMRGNMLFKCKMWNIKHKWGIKKIQWKQWHGYKKKLYHELRESFFFFFFFWTSNQLLKMKVSFLFLGFHLIRTINNWLIITAC